MPVGADIGDNCASISFECYGFGHNRPLVFRDGRWSRSNSPAWPDLTWGLPGDIPLAGDYRGTGSAQLGVFRPSTGGWAIEGMPPILWGQTGDVPVPADYDGDGRLDIAIFRPSTGLWAVLPSSGKAALYQRWGTAGDTPVPADYDGDGRADFAVFRPSTGTWFVFMQSAYNRFQVIGSGSTLTVQFGDSTSVPVPADYDGDEITDIATWTPATGMRSVRNGFSMQWGQSGDIPVVTLNR